MVTQYARDAAMTAVVFGFFATTWFGWAQEAPPAGRRRELVVGTVLAVLTAGVGGVLAWRHWDDGTAFDADVSRRFGIVVGIEFAVAALGAGVLALRRLAELIPPWIALVVGAHLFPVASLLDYPLIHLAGLLILIVALAAVRVARTRSVPVSWVTGAATGTVLLGTAAISLAVAAAGS
jgi:hypothetical protein